MIDIFSEDIIDGIAEHFIQLMSRQRFPRSKFNLEDVLYGMLLAGFKYDPEREPTLESSDFLNKLNCYPNLTHSSRVNSVYENYCNIDEMYYDEKIKIHHSKYRNAIEAEHVYQIETYDITYLNIRIMPYEIENPATLSLAKFINWLEEANEEVLVKLKRCLKLAELRVAEKNLQKEVT